MCGKVFLHVNEQGVHHSKYMYMLKKYFFHSLSPSQKNKNNYLKKLWNQVNKQWIK